MFDGGLILTVSDSREDKILKMLDELKMLGSTGKIDNIYLERITPKTQSVILLLHFFVVSYSI